MNRVYFSNCTEKSLETEDRAVAAANSKLQRKLDRQIAAHNALERLQNFAIVFGCASMVIIGVFWITTERVSFLILAIFQGILTALTGMKLSDRMEEVEGDIK